MIADVTSNKKLSQIVTDLLIREKKLRILTAFIIKCYFVVPKVVRLNRTLCFIVQIPNQQELQEIRLNYLSNIDYID